MAIPRSFRLEFGNDDSRVRLAKESGRAYSARHGVAPGRFKRSALAILLCCGPVPKAKIRYTMFLDKPTLADICSASSFVCPTVRDIRSPPDQ